MEEELDQAQIDAQEEADFIAAVDGESGDRPRDEHGRFVARDSEEVTEEEGGEETEDPPEASAEDADDDGEPGPEDQDDDPPAPVEDEDDKLAQRLRRVEGRLGSMNSDMQRMLSATEELRSAMAAASATSAEGGDAPSRAQVKAALESGEKMAALKDEFPEWGEAMEEERNRTIDHLRAEFGANMVSREDAERMADDRARAAAAEARALARLDSRHDGWEDEVKLPEFVAWVRMDDELVHLANSSVVKDSIELLDRWKEYRNTHIHGENREAKQDRNQQRLRRSIPATSSRGATHDRVPSEEDDFLAGFNGG